MGNKHKNKSLTQKKKEEEVAEQVLKEVFEQSTRRRMLIRNAEGKAIIELPLPLAVAIIAIMTIFFFPVLVVSLIVGYASKLRLEVVRDMTDDEANQIDSLNQQDTQIDNLSNSYTDQSTVIF